MAVGDANLQVNIDLSRVIPLMDAYRSRCANLLATPVIRRSIFDYLARVHKGYFDAQAGPDGPWPMLRPSTLRTLMVQYGYFGHSAQYVRMKQKQAPREAFASGREFRAFWKRMGIRGARADMRSQFAARLIVRDMADEHKRFVTGRMGRVEAGRLNVLLGGMRILNVTGQLMTAASTAGGGQDAIRTAEPLRLVYGVNMRKARFIQEGTRRMVARKFIGLRSEDVSQITSIINYYITMDPTTGTN